MQSKDKIKAAIRAKELLLPDGYITGLYAVDARGNNVSTLSPAACKFCLVGALSRATWLEGLGAVSLQTWEAEMSDFLGVDKVTAWSDGQGCVEPLINVLNNYISLLGADR